MADAGLDPPQIHFPTTNEWRRLMRAMYRFQLLACLSLPVGEVTRSSQSANAKLFLSVLNPWEIEELFSFYQFVEEKYDRVLDDVDGDLNPENPAFDDQTRPPTPDGALDLSNSCMLRSILVQTYLTEKADSSTVDRARYLEGLILRGLPLLHTIMVETQTHTSLVSAVQ